MADEDPWVIEDPSESQPEETAVVASEEAAIQVSADVPAPVEASEEDHAPPPEDGNYRKPVTLYRHWVRCVSKRKKRNIFIFIKLFKVFNL